MSLPSLITLSSEAEYKQYFVDFIQILEFRKAKIAIDYTCFLGYNYYRNPLLIAWDL